MSLTDLIKKYGGKWVAVKPMTNDVVVSGKDAGVVYKKAIKKGYDVPTIFRVPSKDINYIGHA